MSFVKIIIIVISLQYIFGCVEKTTYSGKIITNDDLNSKILNKNELIKKQNLTIDGLKNNNETQMTKIEQTKIDRYENEIKHLKVNQNEAEGTFEQENLLLKGNEEKYKLEIQLCFEKINAFKLEKIRLNEEIESKNKTIEELVMSLKDNNSNNNNEKELQNEVRTKNQEILSELNRKKEEVNSLDNKLILATENATMQTELVNKLNIRLERLNEEKRSLEETVEKYSNIIKKLKDDMDNTIMGTVTTMRGEFNDEMLRIEEENLVKLETLQRKAESV